MNKTTPMLVLALVMGWIGLATAQEAAPDTKPKWERSASLGFTITRGNSETLLFTGNVLGTRKSPVDEWNLGADAAYGESDGVKNNENLHGFLQYNRLFADRFYVYGRVDALYDAVADIDYRVALSPGAGYYFIKTAKMRLSAEVGPGAVLEKLGGVENNYWTFRAGQKFDWKITEKTRLWEEVEYLPQVDELDNYVIRGEVGVDTILVKDLSLRVYAQDTFRNQPAPGRKQNDFKLVTALAVKF